MSRFPFASVSLNARIDPTARIEPGAVIYENCEVEQGAIIGANTVLRPGTKVGYRSIIGPLCVSEGDVEVGECTSVMSQCHLTKGLKIGNNCFIGPGLVTTNTRKITAGEHGCGLDKKEAETLPMTIANGARIGSAVTIMPGVRIGECAVIDASCLITKDIRNNEWVRAGKDQVARHVGYVF